METTPSGSTAHAVYDRCPYLGLHDDRSTSLAFPSNWNFCYRAKPPASVVLSHQSEACLIPQYLQCPVYLREKTGRLPSNLRGTAPLPGSSRRGLGIGLLLFLILALAAAALLSPRLLVLMHGGSIGVSGNASVTPFTLPNLPLMTQAPNQIKTALASWTNPALFVPTETSSSTPTVNLTATTATPTSTITKTPRPTRTPTQTPSNTPTETPSNTPTLTPTYTLTSTDTPNLTATNSVSLTMTASSFAEACGHGLDVPFGGSPTFVVHLMAGGESLNMYAEKYQTTTDAILAINYQLTTPIKSGKVIVIPLNTSSVSGIPPFELYQAVEAVVTTDELASQLGTNSQSLDQYNALVEPCTMFSGWVLIPHPQETTTP